MSFGGMFLSEGVDVPYTLAICSLHIEGMFLPEGLFTRDNVPFT